MLTILHGDHEKATEARLEVLLSKERLEHAQLTQLDGKRLTLSVLETAIGTDALFAPRTCIVIRSFGSFPRGKKKDELASWIDTHHGEQTHVILVETSKLTATQMKLFPSASLEVFVLPAIVFAWVEGLGVAPLEKSFALFHQLLENEEPERIFVMLVRQIRLLIGFVADGTYVGSPFGKQKLATQAKHFTLEKLLSLHTELLAIDQANKTSSSPLDLASKVDLWLTRL